MRSEEGQEHWIQGIGEEMKMATAVVMILGAAALVAVPVARTPAFRVTAVAPIVVELNSGSGFVVGTDGIARSCPDAVGVGVFVRREGKGDPNVFMSVLRSAIIVSIPGKAFTLACLKVE